MTLQEFEELFELESNIRDYSSNIELLEDNFIEKSRENILVLNFELRRPLGENSSGESTISKFEIWGAGVADPDDKAYGMNARIMLAATKAMLAELKAVNQELIDKRDKMLQAN